MDEKAREEENITEINLGIVGIEAIDAVFLPVDEIHPDSNQPRKIFPDESLHELADSIRNNGLISPIIVRPNGNGYSIVAGERRYRASKLAGHQRVFCIVKNVSEAEAFKLGLIENLHREDLNPIDEAAGYQKLLDEYGWTHERLAQEFKRSRTYVSKILTINKVPEAICDKCATSHIDKNTIIEIAKAPSSETMEKLVDKVVRHNLSVRDVKEEVKSIKEGSQPKEKGRGHPVDNSPVSALRKETLAYDKKILKNATLNPVQFSWEERARLIQAMRSMIEHANGFIESFSREVEG